MLRRAALILSLAIAGALLAAAALAQSSGIGERSAPELVIRAFAVAGQGGGQAPIAIKADSPPVSMTPMLASQNDARARLGLSPLVWSPDLQKASETTVSGLVSGLCTPSMARKAADPSIDAVYWASPIRDIYGGQKAQDISPAFVVSEWKDRAARDSGCDGDATCNAFALITRGASRRVGCATAVCPNQARVWVCRFGD